MSETIEIEFKNMLTETEYNMLLQEFQITEKKIIPQENHYFDTLDFALKQQNSALRIRRKKDQYEMTLKQPAPVGLVETNQLLTEEEANVAIQTGILPSGKIKEIIMNLGISFQQIIYFGSLKTYRAELNYKNGLLVLDHSVYLSAEDFELEYEVTDYEEGIRVFNEMLEWLKIPKRQTNNKIQRFYEKMRKLQSQSDLFEI